MQCDFQSPSCSQCIRAVLPCSGYRDTQKTRFVDESQSVVLKAAKKAATEPRSLPLSVDLQAREAFFSWYVKGTSRCWEFLQQYYHPADSPYHLTLAIEACSLAWLWHEVYSEAALSGARERYILALRVLNKALRSPKEAVKSTTLLTALVLDLFEKITNTVDRSKITKSWTSHVNGALDVARLSDLDRFQNPSDLRVLDRLVNHYIITAVTSSSIVSDGVFSLRSYVAKHMNVHEHTLHLSDAMIDYAKLRSDIQNGVLSKDEYIEVCTEMNVRAHSLYLDMPVFWQFTTTLVDYRSERYFESHFDSYPHRNICQAWNIVRIVRILLNESLIEHYLTSPTEEENLISISVARSDIESLVHEICACTPQFLDCDGAARNVLPIKRLQNLDSPQNLDNGPKDHHLHTPNHLADCHSLLFPLYVAGRCKTLPEVRSWVLDQLHYIGRHFHIRNAQIIAQLLEQESDVCPWEVFGMLGSYAFN